MREQIGVGAMNESPRVVYDHIDYDDKSPQARVMRMYHPRVVAFEKKYENVNWRAKLNG